MKQLLIYSQISSKSLFLITNNSCSSTSITLATPFLTHLHPRSNAPWISSRFNHVLERTCSFRELASLATSQDKSFPDENALLGISSMTIPNVAPSRKHALSTTQKDKILLLTRMHSLTCLQ